MHYIYYQVHFVQMIIMERKLGYNFKKILIYIKLSKKPISAIMKIRSYAVEILMKESDKKLGNNKPQKN